MDDGGLKQQRKTSPHEVDVAMAAARPRGVEYDGGLLRCPAIDAHMYPLWRCCALFVPFAAAPVTAIACWPCAIGGERRSGANQRGTRAVRTAVARRRQLQPLCYPCCVIMSTSTRLVR